jgi:hypothetical protein
MNTRLNNYVGWALLMHELEDAQEHLTQLIQQLSEQIDDDEVEFRIALGHVYAHLNRAWHARNEPDGIPAESWLQYSQFPTDLEPAG